MIKILRKIFVCDVMYRKLRIVMMQLLILNISGQKHLTSLKKNNKYLKLNVNRSIIFGKDFTKLWLIFPYFRKKCIFFLIILWEIVISSTSKRNHNLFYDQRFCNRWQIVGARLAGVGVTIIAELFNNSQATISTALKA